MGLFLWLLTAIAAGLLAGLVIFEVGLWLYEHFVGGDDPDEDESDFDDEYEDPDWPGAPIETPMAENFQPERRQFDDVQFEDGQFEDGEFENLGQEFLDVDDLTDRPVWILLLRLIGSFFYHQVAPFIYRQIASFSRHTIAAVLVSNTRRFTNPAITKGRGIAAMIRQIFHDVAYVNHRIRDSDFWVLARLNVREWERWTTRRIPIFALGFIFLCLGGHITKSTFWPKSAALVPLEQVQGYFPVPEHVRQARLSPDALDADRRRFVQSQYDSPDDRDWDVQVRVWDVFGAGYKARIVTTALDADPAITTEQPDHMQYLEPSPAKPSPDFARWTFKSASGTASQSSKTANACHATTVTVTVTAGAREEQTSSLMGHREHINHTPSPFWPHEDHGDTRRSFGEDSLYCMKCKQWHCCELPY